MSGIVDLRSPSWLEAR